MTEQRIEVDRSVLVVGADGRQVTAQLRVWWLPDDTHRLELAGPWGTAGATADDQFEALVRVRRDLEPVGWRVLVQGARRDCYPSGMQRDQGGGSAVYVLRPGRRTTRDDVRETFAPAEPDEIGTVAEQEEHWRACLAAPLLRSADEGPVAGAPRSTGRPGGARLPWPGDGDVPGRGRHRWGLVADAARAVRRGLRRGR